MALPSEARPRRLTKSFLLAALLLLALGSHSYAVNLRFMGADESDRSLPLISGAGGTYRPTGMQS